MLDFNLFILAACCTQNSNELMQKYKNQKAEGNCTDRHIMPSFVVHVRLEAAWWLTYRPQAGRQSGRNPC